MSNELEREAFEKWAESNFYKIRKAQKWGGGESDIYSDSCTSSAWAAWQAARAQPEQPKAGVVPEKAREAARRAIELCRGDVLDEYPEVARAHIKGLADLILTAAPIPEARQSDPVAYWDGDTGEAETAFQFDRDAIYKIPVYTHPHNGEQGEPDMFWDDNNAEDSGQECAHDLADYCSQDLPFGETMVVDVQCAKRLPNRKMKIWVDGDDDLHWEWVEPQPPKSKEG